MANNYFPVNNFAANPAYYQHIFWSTPFGGSPVPDSSVAANGIHYPGDTVKVWFQNPSAATAYKVIDWYGNVVTTGTLTGTNQLVTVTPPGGGWQLGWYRIYFSGASTDATWGDTYASTMFSFVRSSSNFPAMPSSQTNISGGSGQSNDFARKGALGFGTSRMIITNAGTPNTGSGTGGDFIGDLENDINNYAGPYWTAPTSSQYLDPVRPRQLWCAFPNGTGDTVSFTFSGGEWGRAFARNSTVDGSLVYVKGAAGSSSGSKIQVFYPNNSTLVETWDNLASVSAAQTAINAGSSYIYVYGAAGITTSVITGPSSATVCGNTKTNGVIATVQALYPLGVTYYEGPFNEPSLSSPFYVGSMRQFADAVHAGNANAKAIGPTPVDIDFNLGSTWKAFLDNGGGAYPDEIAFHAYNATSGGDFNLGRKVLTHFTGYLAKYGLSSKKLWQTESTWAQVSNYGLYQPRASAWQTGTQLLMEQFGITREKNNHWYDVSHGFWGVPAWWTSSSGCIHPPAILARTLSDETWGLNHREKITFGENADNMFLGSVYGDPGVANVAVVMAHSWMPTSSVTFRLFGPTQTSLTYSDPWGTTSTLTVTSNLVTMPVQEIPCYLRLPAGVRVQVDHVNDWPSTTMKNLAPQATTFTINGGSTSSPELCDGRFLWDYPSYTTALAAGGQRTSAATASSGSPDTVTLLFPSTISIDRVIIWAGNVWQKASTLIDFDVQTTANGGSSWTTQQTIDKSAQADNNTYQHGSAQRDVACQTETWWDMQHIFDVNLGGAVSCNGVRLNVRRTSFGGAPNQSGSDACAFWGSADTAQHVTVQEVAVIDSAHTQPSLKARTFNGTSDQVVFGPRSEHLVTSSTGKFTVAGWCYPSAFAARQVVASGGSSGDHWELALTPAAAPSWAKITSAGGSHFITGTQTFTANTWQYISASVDLNAGTVRFLRVLENGTFTGNTQTDTNVMSYGAPVVGAGPSLANPFGGKLWQVAIWADQALTDSQLVYAALNGSDLLSPSFYAPLTGLPVENDATRFGLTGIVTGTTTSTSGLPAVTEACARTVGMVTI